MYTLRVKGLPLHSLPTVEDPVVCFSVASSGPTIHLSTCLFVSLCLLCFSSLAGLGAAAPLQAVVQQLPDSTDSSHSGFSHKTSSLVWFYHHIKNDDLASLLVSQLLFLGLLGDSLQLLPLNSCIL